VPPRLLLRDIELTFGGVPLLEGASLAVEEGDRLCLVGRNGSGKSTLLKIAAGLLEPDAGERFVQPGVTVRYLPQEPSLSGFETTWAYVKAALAPGDDEHYGLTLLQQLGLSGDENPESLSGGESRRVALAAALAPRPDILLLDEPTNHLDLPAIEWLENELKNSRSALVMISHDRRFLETLSDATVWIDRGETRRLEKGFSAFEAWRDEILELDELDTHKLKRKIVREEHWLRHGVSARRKRNQGRLRDLQALRKQHREKRTSTGAVNMTMAEGAQSGKRVCEAKNVSKSYGELDVVRDLSLRIQRGDRLGIVGPNGAGKTTILNLLTGASEPDEGELRLGINVELVSLDQRREELKPEWTLADALTGGRGDMVFIGDKPRHVIGYMKDFLFTPNQANTPISALSGGERGRLMLARALARPSNLLVLDEPTNDLDLETLDLLQEMLSEYSGTLFLVSHDRDFIDRVVTSVLVSEGKGAWQEYAGGYTDMLTQRGEDVREKVKDKNVRSSSSKKTEKTRKPSKQKLSFKQKYALETLPAEIDSLHVEIDSLQAVLADGDLYARDPEGFQGTAKKLETAQARLAEAEESWLELELLREELEDG